MKTGTRACMLNHGIEESNQNNPQHHHNSARWMRQRVAPRQHLSAVSIATIYGLMRSGGESGGGTDDDVLRSSASQHSILRVTSVWTMEAPYADALVSRQAASVSRGRIPLEPVAVEPAGEDVALLLLPPPLRSTVDRRVRMFMSFLPNKSSKHRWRLSRLLMSRSSSLDAAAAAAIVRVDS